MLSALSLDCVLIVGVSLLGGMLPLATVLNHTRLQVYLSFSAGSMLGAAFFHMLPEAVRMGTPQTVRWTAVGLLALFFLERFFSFHQHEPRDPAAVEDHSADPSRAEACTHDEAAKPVVAHDHAHSNTGSKRTPSALSWGTAAFGLAIHSLVGGVALASADDGRFCRAPGHRRHGLGRFPCHRCAQACRRSDHRAA